MKNTGSAICGAKNGNKCTVLEVEEKIILRNRHICHVHIIKSSRLHSITSSTTLFLTLNYKEVQLNGALRWQEKPLPTQGCKPMTFKLE